MIDIGHIVAEIKRPRKESPPSELLERYEARTRSIFDRCGFEVDDEREFAKVIRFVSEYAASMKNHEYSLPKGLLIYGGTGTGKTTAARIISRIIGAPLVDMRSVAEGWIHTESLYWDFDYHRDTAIIIDDLGAEGVVQKFGNRMPVGRMIDQRSMAWERRGIPTIITSNCETLNDIGRWYDGRVQSRVFGMATPVRFAGRDRRMDY